LDGAKADLETLLALDPTLKEPARELVLVKRKAAEIREAEKKQFAGAFAKVCTWVLRCLSGVFCLVA
jgi:hypothetical protein